MSAALLNVLIGLVTSVLSGGVWALNRTKQARMLNRRADFFGLEGGAPCVVVMNDKYSKPGSMAQDDVYALVEIAMLGRELGSPVTIRRAREFRERNGSSTEFCIGGPSGGSNPRTGGHLAAHLPGVTVLPFSRDDDSMAFLIDGELFGMSPVSENVFWWPNSVPIPVLGPSSSFAGRPPSPTAPPSTS
ncbi:hypothetical protein [Actinomadura soli]|uniref:hypothetical protein n=1 Tax=Actinomadura soli TaxID=2508997 RepID=UPI00197ADBE2|nr:hypothetical protein [Actinomadura soli]